MKKFILGMMVLSVMVFGANVQQKTPQMKVVTPASKDSAGLSPKVLKGAKKISFKESEPAQLILEVPVNLDPVPIGMEVEGELTTGSQVLICALRQDTSRGDKWSYKTKIVLHSGQYTVDVKFNGIPVNELVRINAYNCKVRYTTSSGTVSPFDIPSSIFKERSTKICACGELSF